MEQKIKDMLIRMSFKQEHLFYAAMIMQMDLKKQSIPGSLGFAVGYSNGLPVLYYDPDIIEQNNLKANHIIHALEHELLHVMLGHFSRFSELDLIVNLGTDMAIESILGKIDLPIIHPGESPWKDPPFNMEEGWSAEQYINRLRKVMPKVSYNPENGKAKIEWEDSDGNKQSAEVIIDKIDRRKYSDASKSFEKAIIQEAVRKAQKEVEKRQGSIPGNLKDIIDALLDPPVVDWRRFIRNFIGKAVKANKYRSWKYLNRRLGELAKGNGKKRTVRVVVAIDTSGSVSNNEIAKFLREIRGIMAVNRNTSVKVIQCDAGVTKVEEMTRWHSLKIEVKGRGGTSFIPVFDYIKEKHIPLDALVYLTDLEGTFPKEAPVYPVLWVSTTNEVAPFGNTVKLEEPK